MKRGVYIVGIGSISSLGAFSRDALVAYGSGRQGLRTHAIGNHDRVVGAAHPQAEERLNQLVHEQANHGRLDRSTRLAILAAREALARSETAPQRASMGVIIGSSRGATENLEAAHGRFVATGRSAAHTSPTTTLGNLASNVARELGASGLVAEISSTCSTSMQALILGISWLRAGFGRACLVGGAEAPLTAFTLAQFDALGLLDRDLAPGPQYQPLARFSRNRLVLGEGACVFSVETLSTEEARQRGALAEIVGFGSAVESSPSLTGVSRGGEGFVRAMTMALAGNDRPVDAVVVHAPGTENGDSAELAALASVFGSRLPALCSAKWQMGHTLGASGAFGIELGLALLAGLRPPDPPYDSQLRAPLGEVKNVLVNSAGFGGVTASVVLRRTGRDEPGTRGVT